MLGHLRSAALCVAIAPLLMTGAAAASTAGAHGASTTSNSCGSVPRLHKAVFAASPSVTNPFLPLVPGTQIILDGFVVDANGAHVAHRIESTVTDLTKVVDGVRGVAVLERDFQGTPLVLQESELYFQAQDTTGREWLLGEYPEEYTNGVLTGAPATWISGVGGDTAGIAMLANPTAGDPAYLQGHAPAVGFHDCATVFQTGESHVCVPAGCFDNVLETDEFSPKDRPGGHQRKFYAPGVGNIRVTAVGGVDPETVSATRTGTLCTADVTTFRQLALEQDARGDTGSPKVYGTTPALEQTLTAPTSGPCP
ncbi:MAG TPA: hypothetical protein VF112_01190 [Candidatus Dormibacteraeota bacterium]